MDNRENVRKESKKAVLIIIPAYNEGSAIRKTIDGIPKRFPKIIVVDDGSRDNTKDQVSSTRAQLVSHTVNLGQGAALQTAIEYALLDPSIKYFVTYDADGQHRVELTRELAVGIVVLKIAVKLRGEADPIMNFLEIDTGEIRADVIRAGARLVC